MNFHFTITILGIGIIPATFPLRIAVVPGERVLRKVLRLREGTGVMLFWLIILSDCCR
jgi:hypothetical protein